MSQSYGPAIRIIESAASAATWPCIARSAAGSRLTPEILSKVVYAERAHPVEIISKVSLGSLLDLFLTVDEFDARYDFGEQFRAVEPAPVFFGFQAQFKDHGQCRDS